MKTLIALIFLTTLVWSQDSLNIYKKANFEGGVYTNTVPIQKFGFVKGFGLLSKMIFESHPWQVPEDSIPLIKVNTSNLMNSDHAPSFIKIGHSTILFKYGSKLIITDPIFSQRASPFQWVGPKRFHEPAIQLDDLPPIDLILISHNHYDHLDEGSIKGLNKFSPKFIVPMGVKDILIEWGVKEHDITELNWWESLNFDKIKITSVPTQHFSGRGLNDRQETLWMGFVIENDSTKVYFSGDTGYNEGFKEAFKKFGPMDLAFIEAGAYNEEWNSVHMLPNQTILALQDLHAKYAIPIHNGTFDLAFHSWFDPMEQMYFLAKEAKVKVLFPQFGTQIFLDENIESVYKNQYNASDKLWWKPLLPKEYEFKPYRK